LCRKGVALPVVRRLKTALEKLPFAFTRCPRVAMLYLTADPLISSAILFVYLFFQMIITFKSY